VPIRAIEKEGTQRVQWVGGDSGIFLKLLKPGSVRNQRGRIAEQIHPQYQFPPVSRLVICEMEHSKSRTSLFRQFDNGMCDIVDRATI
jgi:hypothetical protein